MTDSPSPSRAKKSAKAKLSFSESTQRLEDIIELMDDPCTDLEQMIALVEEGMILIRDSRAVLEQAQLRIQKLDSLPQQEAPRPRSKAEPTQNDFTLI